MLGIVADSLRNGLFALWDVISAEQFSAGYHCDASASVEFNYRRHRLTRSHRITHHRYPVTALQGTQGCEIDAISGVYTDKKQLVNLMLDQELLKFPTRKSVSTVLDKIVLVNEINPTVNDHPPLFSPAMQSDKQVITENLTDVSYLCA
jgi:hypothetical protein